MCVHCASTDQVNHYCINCCRSYFIKSCVYGVFKKIIIKLCIACMDVIYGEPQSSRPSVTWKVGGPLGGGGGGGEERAPKYAAPQYNRPPHCLIPVSATGYYRWYPGNDPAPHTHTCQPYSHFPPSSRSPTLSIHPMPNLLHLMPTFLPQRPCLASRNDINEVLEVWQHHIAS